MITRLTSAVVGLLAFAGMVLAGLAAGNSVSTILQRALVGLVGGMVVGWVAGYVTENVVHEHFMSVVEKDLQVGYSKAIANISAKEQLAEEWKSLGGDNAEGELKPEDSKADVPASREEMIAAHQQTEPLDPADQMQDQT